VTAKPVPITERIVIIGREKYKLAACGWLDIEAARKLIAEKSGAK
jgi:hypothetical protein